MSLASPSLLPQREFSQALSSDLCHALRPRWSLPTASRSSPPSSRALCIFCTSGLGYRRGWPAATLPGSRRQPTSFVCTHTHKQNTRGVRSCTLTSDSTAAAHGVCKALDCSHGNVTQSLTCIWKAVLTNKFISATPLRPTCLPVQWGHWVQTGSAKHGSGICQSEFPWR